MIYGYTQISQYLTCPRRYRHRYLDACRRRIPVRQCSSAVPSNEHWAPTSYARMQRKHCFGNGRPIRTRGLHYTNGNSWDRMLQQGIQLLDLFCQGGETCQIERPQVTFHYSPGRFSNLLRLLFFWKPNRAACVPELAGVGEWRS
jgi:hypothetical protein